ncbi:Bacterial protein of uncharacterised function (DUF885) [Corynebacterium kutscheri]|uniref:Bacterial protein of uncharacterized function (DUF885) n=2 Tax=Corynebacterium kutscheri TaxID=35755 RepID=A0A0F6R093_9CORY|nr:hypothetical protein UL82_00275 [Corynebacterium kutscheri]VEH05490.1 Bacterial protein of uncharacterised function (DUF885) [Corynebacterium kutscheri]VEH10690.1 Bacterial protein of uncharacterised function (DUF885) [Corynebacterium kutscheri]VEH81381.1 Bacterial protein of uncharacterised function (DUF885) [Corynebacterium kutscheri]
MDLAAISPTQATAWGIAGYDHELQDFSPEYWERVADRTREMLADVDAFDDGTDESDDDEDFDEVDLVTAEVLRDRLCLDLSLHHAGENLRQLNNIASPVQEIRDTFLLMDKNNLAAIESRLAQVEKALAGYRESLAESASHGKVAASRQIDAVIDQCMALTENNSMLDDLGVAADNTALLAAKKAFFDMAEWLGEHLLPVATPEDAVGRDRYERFSHLFVGDVVDLDEAYAWGLDRLASIIAEQETIASQLYGPETSVRTAMKKLNEEPRYLIEGTDALKRWMQDTANQAISDLNGTHFDIPEPMLTCEAMIDPAGTGGIFYTPPSDDFARPGRMWWSVPEGQTTFHTWQELTTVYHESVPGHHLQCGQAIAERDGLNMWRRLACWNSGHGEGWALYAEQLMAELGYHDDPGTRMGMLDAQRLRAARVVLDIGVHLGKKIPDGQGIWDASYARHFLRENSAMDEANLIFELDRYLGWPGQAPSYALGQRLWQQLRDDALEQGQTLKGFHSRALALGSIPMSIVRDQILD